jgi:hypothetical protein
MLELKNIQKTYHVGGIETKALDGISVAFRELESYRKIFRKSYKKSKASIYLR